MEIRALPARFTPHEARIEPYLGSGGLGPTYGPAVTVPAFIVDSVQLVRNPDAQEVVSSAQVTVGFDVVAPVGSKVTIWPGTSRERQSVVVSQPQVGAHPRLPAFQTLSLT